MKPSQPTAEKLTGQIRQAAGKARQAQSPGLGQTTPARGSGGSARARGHTLQKVPKKRRKSRIPPGNPRARAKTEKPQPVTPEEKRARVWRMAELMASGEWEPKLIKRLAQEWQLAESSVRVMSAEASRLVELTTHDRTTLRNLARIKLRKWIEQEGDDRASLIRTLLEHLGELRQNVSVTTPDPFEGWTEEEIERFANTGERPKRVTGGEQG